MSWRIYPEGADPATYRGTPLEAALREFQEETGFDPRGPFYALGRIVQRSGKTVHAWAFEGDCDPAQARSNTTRTEWPPRSGRFIEIPEVDRVAFFLIEAISLPTMLVVPGIRRLLFFGSLAIAAGLASWLLFERPIQRLKRHFPLVRRYPLKTSDKPA